MNKIPRKRKAKRVERKRLTVYVPPQLLHRIDERVAIAKYRSRSDLVEQLLRHHFGD